MIGTLLTDHDRAVLVFLSRTGAATRFGISSRLKLHHSVPYVVLRRLKSRGLVRVVKRVKWRTGLKSLTYAPTIRGVLVALSTKEGWRAVDEIIEVQRELVPLVFGKFEHLRREGVEDIAKGRLRTACSIVGGTVPIDALTGETLGPIEDESERVASNFYNPVYINRPHAEVKRFYRAIGKDPELRGFVGALLDRLSAYYRDALKYNEELKLSLIGFEPKAPATGRR